MARNDTSSRLKQALHFRNRGDKTEINKYAHQWRLGGDDRVKFGIRDCPRVLRRGRRFCSRRLMPRVLPSKEAGRITSFLVTSHMVCQDVHVCVARKGASMDWTTTSSYNLASSSAIRKIVMARCLHYQYTQHVQKKTKKLHTLCIIIEAYSVTSSGFSYRLWRIGRWDWWGWWWPGWRWWGWQ